MLSLYTLQLVSDQPVHMYRHLFFSEAILPFSKHYFLLNRSKQQKSSQFADWTA